LFAEHVNLVIRVAEEPGHTGAENVISIGGHVELNPAAEELLLTVLPPVPLQNSLQQV
jgi:hypothetical protein